MTPDFIPAWQHPDWTLTSIPGGYPTATNQSYPLLIDAARWPSPTIELLTTTAGAVSNACVVYWTISDLAEAGDTGALWHAVPLTSTIETLNGTVYHVWRWATTSLTVVPRWVKVVWTEGTGAGTLWGGWGYCVSLPESMAPTPTPNVIERIYPLIPHSNNGATPTDQDSRVSVTGPALSSLYYGNAPYDTLCDDVEIALAAGTAQAATPVATLRTLINPGATVTLTPTLPNATTLSIIGDCSNHASDTWQISINGGTPEQYQASAAGLPSWGTKGPVYTSGVIAGGIQSVAITCPANAPQPLTPYLFSFGVGQPHNRTVLVVGDSYTANNRSFIWHLRNLLKLWYPESDLEFVTMAQSGRTSAELLLGNVHNATALDILLAAYAPSLVLWTLGRNDATLVRATMQNILTKVHAAGAAFAWLDPFSTGYTQTSQTTWAQQWAAEVGVRCYDLGRDVNTIPGYVYNTHPSNGGNAYLGRILAQWFVAQYGSMV